MSNRNVPRLNFARRIALVTAGLAALAAPVAVGILNAPPIRAQSPQAAQPTPAAPAFEVASIKLNTNCVGGGRLPSQSPVTFNLPCVPLSGLIAMAYSVTASGFPSRFIEVLGGPDWMDKDRYDISAKAAGSASQFEMMGPMLQKILEERFQVKVHRESRDAPVYELTVAKNGPKLQPSKEGTCTPMDLNNLSRNVKPGDPRPRFCGNGGGTGRPGGGMVTDWYSVSIAEYAGRMLTGQVDRPVIDKTGRYDIHLEFAPEDPTSGAGRVTLNGVERPDLPAPSTDPRGPSIFIALQEQLGLKLTPVRGPLEVIVVDHAEKPSAN